MEKKVTITKAYLPFSNKIKLDNFEVKSDNFMDDIEESLSFNLNQFPLNLKNEIACHLALKIQFIF